MGTTTTTQRTGTYQMLWDCPVCGTQKLLGVDHRHCPNCGAAQEENLRYFPSKSDRVATEFRGTEADWECERCGTPNGSEGGFCAGCGAPRGGSAAVHVRASISADQGETGADAARDWKQRQATVREQRRAGRGPKPPPPTRWQRVVAWFKGMRGHPWRIVGVGTGVALLALLLLAVCDRQVDLRVTGHSWTRIIPVERYTTLSDRGWCDSIPGDARVSSRTTEIHHYNQIPDGEDCRTVPGSCSQSCSNVDNGNGSFSEVCTETCSSDQTECTTRYREEPVYADMCSYQVDRWVVVRTAESSGIDRAPQWPGEPAYSGCAGASIGCERIGARYGVYLVHYVDPGSGATPDLYQCETPEPSWTEVEPGERFVGEVSRLTGKLDCEELEPADE